MSAVRFRHVNQLSAANGHSPDGHDLGIVVANTTISQDRSPMSDNVQPPDTSAQQALPDPVIAEAMKLLQSGNTEQADKVLRNALAQNRDNVDALYLLGMVGCRTQRWVEAVELIGRAVELEPRRVKYFNDLGEAQVALGRFEDAVSSFRALLSEEPENALALFNLGRVCVLQGQPAEAIPHIERAISAQPEFVEARRGLASLLLESGRAADAVAQYEEILRQAPDDIEAAASCGAAMTVVGRAEEAVELLGQVHAEQGASALILGNLGLALAAADRGDEAVPLLQEALALEPENPQFLNNLGNLLRKLGRHTEAEEQLLHALNLRDDYAEARNNLALVYFDQERYAEAESEIIRAYELAPEAPRVLNNLGLVQQYTNRMDEAAENFRKALERDPSYLEAETNLATVYAGIGRLDEAIKLFDSVIARNPSGLTARWNRCNALLLSGDYGRGWDEYEQRWEIDGEVPRTFAQPHWDDEDLSGRSIMVYGEQGPGDVVMFTHCLNDLASQAAKISIQVDDRLVSLLRRSFAACKVDSDKSSHGIWQATEADFVVPFGSLPKHFRRCEEDFKRQVGRYLETDPAAVEIWRKRYAELGDGPKVGISWRGGVSALERSRRVMNLAEWSELLGDTRLTVVNLQHGDSSEDLASLQSEHGVTVHSWDNTGVDLDEFAAQIDALDLVISMANTTAHFAGALDKPVWMLAPTQPSWRWQIDRPDSPWYRSVRIFRQDKDQMWGQVLAKIGDEIEPWIDGRGKA